MVDVLIEWRKEIFTTMGEEVSCEIRPLNREAMMVITPLIASALGKENDTAYMMGSTFEMQEKAAEIFPNHVRNIQGLTVNNGQPVDVDILTNESVFARLCVDILSKLFEISTLTDAEIKK